MTSQQSSTALTQNIYDAQGFVLCRCTGNDNRAIRRISRTAANPDRAFWRCRLDKPNDCRFFMWEDALPPKPPPTPPSSAYDTPGTLKRAHVDDPAARPVTPPPKRVALTLPITPVTPSSSQVNGTPQGRSAIYSTQEGSQYDPRASQETISTQNGSGDRAARADSPSPSSPGQDDIERTDSVDMYHSAAHAQASQRTAWNCGADTQGPGPSKPMPDWGSGFGSGIPRSMFTPPRSSSQQGASAPARRSSFESPESPLSGKGKARDFGGHGPLPAMRHDAAMSADEIDSHLVALRELPDYVRMLQKETAADKAVIRTLSGIIEELKEANAELTRKVKGLEDKLH